MAFADMLKQGFAPQKDMAEAGWFGRTMGGGDPNMTPYEQEMAGRQRFASGASGLANLFFSGTRGDELRAANQEFRSGLPAQAEALAKQIGARQERESGLTGYGEARRPGAPAPAPSTGNAYGALEGYRDVNVANQLMGGLPATQNIRPGFEYPGLTAQALAPPGPAPDTSPQPLAAKEGMGATNTLNQLLDTGTPYKLPEGYKMKTALTYADGTKENNEIMPIPPPAAGGGGTATTTSGQPARTADKPNVGSGMSSALAGGPGSQGPFTGGVDYSPMAYGLGLPIGQAIDPQADALARELARAEIAAKRAALSKAQMPVTRTLQEGRDKVTYEQQADGSWAEIARGPMDAPDKAAGFDTETVQEGREQVTYQVNPDGTLGKEIARGPMDAPDAPESPSVTMSKVTADGRTVTMDVPFDQTGMYEKFGFQMGELDPGAAAQQAYEQMTPTEQVFRGLKMDWDTGQAVRQPGTGNFIPLEPFWEGMGKRGGPEKLYVLGDTWAEAGELTELFQDPDVADSFTAAWDDVGKSMIGQAADVIHNRLMLWAQNRGVASPGFIDAAARLSKLASEERSRLFGASLTQSEASAALPFLPSAGDSLDTIRGKLGALREEAEDAMRSRIRGFGSEVNMSSFLKSYNIRDPFAFLNKKQYQVPGGHIPKTGKRTFKPRKL